MYEKCNPSHPDKIADRIAGAIVDLAYTKEETPKIAVEVLIGHGICHIITETSVHLNETEIRGIVRRIAGGVQIDYKEYKQDEHLAQNQSQSVRCGDNGIFKGVPTNEEENLLSKIAKSIYSSFQSDGKYIVDGDTLVLCQSNVVSDVLRSLFPEAIVNPLGDWTGGTNVDTGATNRKLGSDMGRAATGGGLHGKDLSKADVSINVFLWWLAQEKQQVFECSCAIGDEFIYIVDEHGNQVMYTFKEITQKALEIIKGMGGFEALAEWGLI